MLPYWLCSLSLIIAIFLLYIWWVNFSIPQAKSLFIFFIFISIMFLTPYWIYMLIRNWRDLYPEVDSKDVEYSWFWIRFLAHIIDYLLWYLVIPVFFNIYFWLKDWQTIWYKIFKIKLYRVNGDKLSSPTWIQLFVYPYAKLISFLTLLIWFIMIWLTERKQWLHNMITNTVAVKVEK